MTITSLDPWKSRVYLPSIATPARLRTIARAILHATQNWVRLKANNKNTLDRNRSGLSFAHWSGGGEQNDSQRSRNSAPRHRQD